ncbi:hypothetical protein SALBM135S_01211 [Streptomyces alboniger]
MLSVAAMVYAVVVLVSSLVLVMGAVQLVAAARSRGPFRRRVQLQQFVLLLMGGARRAARPGGAIRRPTYAPP